MAVFNEDVRIVKNLFLEGSASGFDRNDLDQETLLYAVPFSRMRVWDAWDSILPNSAAADDWAIITGTWGTDVPHLEAGDHQSLGLTTRYFGFEFDIPPEFDDGSAISAALFAGMKTTVADTSCNLDVECYKSDKDMTVVAGDKILTASQDMNSLTFAELAFTISPTGLASGDKLLFRVASVCTDSASSTAVIPAVGDVAIRMTVRG